MEIHKKQKRRPRATAGYCVFFFRCLILVHGLLQARELVAVLPDLFPGSLMPVLLQAAVHVRENKAGEADILQISFLTSAKSSCLQGHRLLPLLATLRLQPSLWQKFLTFNTNLQLLRPSFLSRKGQEILMVPMLCLILPSDGGQMQ